MNFKINISILFIAAVLAVSCNSSKKNVESGDSKEYANFNRVGSLDTMQDALILPGNIKSIDAYIVTANKGLINDMRMINEGGSNKQIILGGKSTTLIKSTFKTLSPTPVSYSFYRKDGELLYVNSEEVNETEATSYKYYFSGGKITDILVAKTLISEEKSTKSPEWKKSELIPGKEAELKKIEDGIIPQFLTLPPYKGKVFKTGDNFTFTSCFDGKEFTIEDKNGSLGKAFKERGIEAGKYLMYNLQGMKDENKKMITVTRGDLIPTINGVAECF